MLVSGRVVVYLTWNIWSTKTSNWIITHGVDEPSTKTHDYRLHIKLHITLKPPIENYQESSYKKVPTKIPELFKSESISVFLDGETCNNFPTESTCKSSRLPGVLHFVDFSCASKPSFLYGSRHVLRRISSRILFWGWILLTIHPVGRGLDS